MRITYATQGAPGHVNEDYAVCGNEWVVVVLWATPQDADAAAARAEQDPARGELMALVEGSSVVRKRYTTFD